MKNSSFNYVSMGVGSKGGGESFSLSGINFSVREGELLVVVGPVGAGKVTFFL
jgi:ABC-type multidrug transport system ATPase subunit